MQPHIGGHPRPPANLRQQPGERQGPHCPGASGDPAGTQPAPSPGVSSERVFSRRPHSPPREAARSTASLERICGCKSAAARAGVWPGRRHVVSVPDAARSPAGKETQSPRRGAGSLPGDTASSAGGRGSRPRLDSGLAARMGRIKARGPAAQVFGGRGASPPRCKHGGDVQTETCPAAGRAPGGSSGGRLGGALE